MYYGELENSQCRAKKSGVQIMIIFGCKKNRSADENRERRFFFFYQSLRRPIKNHRHFMRQFPALAVSSVLTSQLLNNKKIVVFLL